MRVRAGSTSAAAPRSGRGTHPLELVTRGPLPDVRGKPQQLAHDNVSPAGLDHLSPCELAVAVLVDELEGLHTFHVESRLGRAALRRMPHAPAASIA
eukprot:4420249-Prymnesium_polylepis.2